MDSKEFKKSLKAIAKEYEKKTEYMRARRDRKYERLFKKVSTESPFPAGTTIKITSTTRDLSDSSIPPFTVTYSALVLEVLPDYDGVVRLRIEILDEKDGSLTGKTETLLDHDNTICDPYSTAGLFESVFKIKRVKSKNKPG